MWQTGAGEQIKAITFAFAFAFISGAQHTQIPLWPTIYHEHINNWSYDQNPLLPSGLFVWLLLNQLPFCNQMCCAFAHRNTLPSLNCTWQNTISSYSHPGSSACVRQWKSTGNSQGKHLGESFTFTSAYSSLSSPLLLHRLVPSCSIFLPGSGNRCGQDPSWKCHSHSIHSLNRIICFWGDFRTVCSRTTPPNFADVRKFKNCAVLSETPHIYDPHHAHTPTLPASVRKADRGAGIS